MAVRFGDRKRRIEIYIGNYPERFREQDLRRLFDDHGIKVATIRMKAQGPKVYAFAETESSHMIDKAKRTLDGKEIGGRKIVVRSSRDTTRDKRSPREVRSRSSRDRSPREARSSRDRSPREARSSRDRSPREARTPKDPRSPREPREARSPREPRSPRERSPREPCSPEQREHREHRWEAGDSGEKRSISEDDKGRGERVGGATASHDDRVNAEEEEEEEEEGDDRALHYGDLCRFFVKQLRREGAEEVEAQRVGTVMVDCWRTHNYEFHELEEMYLINMEQNDDRDLLGKELGKTLGEGKLPQGLTPGRLVTLTLEFFASEPRMEEMLRKAGGQDNQLEETTLSRSEDICDPEDPDSALDQRKMAKTKKRELELPPRPEIKMRPKRPKMSKFDSLKPISNFLENMLIKNGVDAANVELIVFDITARFVTAGYGWDKIIMYHSKGEEKFVRKLLPYLQKSTSEFPAHMTCQDVLSLTFEFIDDWKLKLFNMIYKEQEEEANELPARPSSPPYPLRMDEDEHSPSPRRRPESPRRQPESPSRYPESSRRPTESPRRHLEKPSVSKEKNEPRKKEWDRQPPKDERDKKFMERRPRSQEKEKMPLNRPVDESRKSSMRLSDDDRRPPFRPLSEDDRRPPGRPLYEEERKFHHTKTYEEERIMYEQGRGYPKPYAYNDEDRRPFQRYSEAKNSDGERRPYYEEDRRYPPKHFDDERRPPIKRDFAEQKYKAPPPRAIINGPRGNVGTEPPSKYSSSDREKYPERWRRSPNEEGMRPMHPGYPRENRREERKQDKYGKKEGKIQRKEEAKSRNGKLSSTEVDDGKTTYYHYSDDNKRELDHSPPRERKPSQSSLSSSMQNILLKKQNENRRAKIKEVRGKKKRDGSSSSRSRSRSKSRSRSRDKKSSSSQERKSSSSDSEREDSYKASCITEKKKKLRKSVSPRDKKTKVIESSKNKTLSKEGKKEPVKRESQKPEVKKEDNGGESSDGNTSEHESKYNNDDETEIRHVRRISSDIDQSDSDSKEKPPPKKAKTLLEKVNEIIKSCVVLKKGGQEKSKEDDEKKSDEEENEEDEEEIDNVEEKKEVLKDIEIKESEIKKEKNKSSEDEVKKDREIKKEKEVNDAQKELKKARDQKDTREIKKEKEKDLKEEKGIKLNHINNQDDDEDGSLESGELNSDAENTDNDISLDIFDEEDRKLDAKLKLEQKKKARTVTIIKKKKKLESLKLAQKKKILALKAKIQSDKSSEEDNSESRIEPKKHKVRHHRKRSSGSSSKSHSRSPPRYKRMMSQSRSRSRSWSRERERRHQFERSRSWSRERGRPMKRWSRSRSRERHSRSPHAQGLRQDFSHRGFQTTNKWIPISPCTLLDDVEIESQSSMMIDVSIKGEFSFKENCGCMVRITKWTGRDAVRNIEIRSQIITLTDTHVVQIEIENPIPNKNLFLQKGDKVACISILSAPTYPGLFAGLTSPVDTYRTATKKWFRVASVVLHRKGGLDRITIPPGRTMKVIATCIGPLSKYIGKEVLITKLDKFDDFPVKPQISQIFENDNIGIDVINKSNRTIMIEKCGKAVAVLGVWTVVKIDPENMRY